MWIVKLNRRYSLAGLFGDLTIDTFLVQFWWNMVCGCEHDNVQLGLGSESQT